MSKILTCSMPVEFSRGAESRTEIGRQGYEICIEGHKQREKGGRRESILPEVCSTLV